MTQPNSKSLEDLSTFVDQHLTQLIMRMPRSNKELRNFASQLGKPLEDVTLGELLTEFYPEYENDKATGAK